MAARSAFLALTRTILIGSVVVCLAAPAHTQASGGGRSHGGHMGNARSGGGGSHVSGFHLGFKRAFVPHTRGFVGTVTPASSSHVARGFSSPSSRIGDDELLPSAFFSSPFFFSALLVQNGFFFFFGFRYHQPFFFGGFPFFRVSNCSFNDFTEACFFEPVRSVSGPGAPFARTK